MPTYVGNKRRKVMRGGGGAKKARISRRRPRAMRKTLMGRTLTALTNYDFKRSVYMPQVLNTQANTTMNFSFSATLNAVNLRYQLGAGTAGSAPYAVPSHTEFTNLFDYYKIKSVKLTFIPRVNSVDAANNIATYPAFPNVMLVRDYDDDALHTRDQLCQHNDMSLIVADKPFSYTVKPKFTYGVGSGGLGTITTPAAGVGSGWLDTVYDNINWYGVKGVVTGYQYTCFDVLADIIYCFKGAR